MELIKQYQREIRRDGLQVECWAFGDSILLRGRVEYVSDARITLRLIEPCRWRLTWFTWSDWRHRGYRPFEVDLDAQAVSLSR